MHLQPSPIPSDLGGLETLKFKTPVSDDDTASPIPSDLGGLETSARWRQSKQRSPSPIPSDLGGLETAVGICGAVGPANGSSPIPSDLGGLETRESQA